MGYCPLGLYLNTTGSIKYTNYLENKESHKWKLLHPSSLLLLLRNPEDGTINKDFIFYYLTNYMHEVLIIELHADETNCVQST